MDEFPRPIRHVIKRIEFLKITKRGILFEAFGVIAIRGGEGVADIFHRPTPWHRSFDDSPREEVHPIFPVMLIPFRVMLTNQGKIAMADTFFINRRMVAAIITLGIMEFRVAEFGEVVTEGLEKDAAMGGVDDHVVAVTANQGKVFKRVSHAIPPINILMIPRCLREKQNRNEGQRGSAPY